MAYARQRRITIERVSPELVEAQARGTADYRLRLEVHRAEGIWVACSCPYAADRPCKHIWGLMVELDRTHPGVYETSGGGPIALWLADGEWEEAAEEVAVDEEREEEGWRDRLRSIHVRGAEEPEAELELRLDLEDSRDHGVLAVRFYTRKRRADGSLGAARNERLTPEKAGRLLGEADARLVELLLTCARGTATGYAYTYGGYGYAWGGADLSPAAFSILPALCASGKLGLAAEDGTLAPLAWDGERPFALRVDVRGARGGVAAEGVLERGEETVPLAEAALVHAGGVAIARGRIIGIEERGEARQLAVVLRGGPLEARKAEAGAMVAALVEAAGVEALAVAPEAGISIERAAPVVRVVLEKQDGRRLAARVRFRYREEWVEARERRTAWMEGRALVVRDRAKEAEALEAIANAGVKPWRRRRQEDEDEAPDGSVEMAEAAAVARRLIDAGVEVWAEGARVRSGRSAALKVRTGIDWFDLEATLDFDGVPGQLPALLAALRAGSGLVKLGDGSVGLVPEEWVRRFGVLARVGRASGDAIRFATAQAALLDSLLEREAATVDETFARMRERLRRHARVKPRAAPRGFRGELRRYQEEGLGWLCFLEELGLGGCLADDMGLGKTIQVLAHLLGRRERRRRAGEPHRPSLVVVPRTLLFNWEAEAARFTPTLAVHVHHGGARGERRPELERADLVVTTYATLVRDIEMFAGLELDHAVLDEAQAIKNPRSQTAKACRALVARHRLALSGTPVENRLTDLGSIMEFLNPGMVDAAAVLAPLTSTDLGDAGLEVLARALRPFLLRRTKAEVLRELPAKVEQDVTCELDGKQLRMYEELRAHYRASLRRKVAEKGLARSKIHVLEALLRLRQAACHPGLIDKDRREEPSAKLEALIDRLLEVCAGGHKALVFSQFTSFLDLVRHRLERAEIRYEYIDGKTRDRGARVARFQEDAGCQVFLLSLKAAGHGLNLTAADYVFILDPWWNPAVEAQAVDRAHRLGQERTVFTYRLIAQGTVEEKVLALQAAKRRLADAIIREDASLLGQLTSSDLDLLLA